VVPVFERREKGRRGRRVESLIREIVSEALVNDINDPRVGFVTVTGVRLSPDLRTADVSLSVLGDERQQALCVEAVRHAHGFLQERVGDALEMKYCPVLKFHLDESVKRSVDIGSLIARARAEDEAAREERVRRGVEEPEPEDGNPPDETGETE
jgi:ribosome-binding factor A